VGHLLLAAVVASHPLAHGWVASELHAHRFTYGYLVGFALLAFLSLGFILGRREDVLEDVAATDALTGLANRRAFDARARAALRRLRRAEDRLSVLLVDVDRLKRINDAGGHAAGDAALRGVSDALRATCRGSDLPARIAGDEFAVLAVASAAQAAQLAHRIRLALAHATRDAVTVSIGIAEAPSGGTLEDLLERADRALYRAKAGGRDRWTVDAQAPAPGNSMRNVVPCPSVDWTSMRPPADSTK
jgi:diguanylate cyclase (GGDEF)-like protein